MNRKERKLIKKKKILRNKNVRNTTKSNWSAKSKIKVQLKKPKTKR